MTKVIDQSQEWARLRPALNNNYNYNGDWKNAIGILDHRFVSHYFFPLDILVNRKDHEGEGFTIASVICSFIEMLAAFESGKIYNLKYKSKTDPSYHYNSSSKLYIEFLQTAPVFKDHFWQHDANGQPESDKPLAASDFYENVRCALIHEGRTKNGWTINATKKDNMADQTFIKINGSKKSLMRSIWHRRMIDHLTYYIERLKDPSPQKNDLRRLYARKMDHLFEIPPDQTYQWWLDI
ncbi:MAG TPA: hypothetical protein VGN20_21720 [Mucilaginibacter sp.]|jgi:hypothetical protein